MPVQTRLAGCAVAALSLAGCATYQARPIEPQQTARAFEQRRLDDPALQRYIAAHTAAPTAGAALPVDVWTPATLTLAAFYFSPELDLARARAATAQAAVVTAGERPNPALLLPLGSTVRGAGRASPYLIGLGLDIPIETAGKRGYRQARAEGLGIAARLGIGEVAWGLRGRLRAALLDLYRDTHTRALLERRVAAQSHALALIERRLALGAASVVETHAARVATAGLEAALARADAARADDRSRIAAVIGLPLDGLNGVEIRLDAFEHEVPLPPPSEVRREALRNRADLRIALAQYDASQAALQLEIAKQYPDIHLGPGYELDQTDNKWTLGLTLDLPVFNHNQGPIAEARARRRLAAAQFVAVQAKALSETETAFATYEAARAQSATAAALQRGLQQRLASARAMQRAGEVDPLAVASADVEYVTGALQHLDAVIKAQQALGALEAAVQSPQVLPPATVRQAETASSHEP